MSNPSRIRVAVVSTHFPTSRQRWAGHSAYQTLRKLARLCDLHVFYPAATYPPLLAPSSQSEPIDLHWTAPDVAVSYIPFPLIPLLSRPLNGFAISHYLLPHVREFKPDIVLNYVVYPDGHGAVRIARALRVPCVLTAVGSDLNRIADPLCGFFTKRALRNADVVTAVSKDLRQTALKLGANPATAMAKLHGCDTSNFFPRDRQQARQSLSLDPQAEIVVYVGRLDSRKGLAELIEATAILRATRPRLCCYIVGDGADRPELVKAIERLGVANEVILIPSVSTDQVAVWMAACDVFTLPSYKEGCPNVIIEALCSGRPVVATRVGGIPELMDDTCGRLIPPMDAPALADALDTVLDRQWNPTAIASGRGVGWDDVAHQLHTVLENTVRTHRA